MVMFNVSISLYRSNQFTVSSYLFIVNYFKQYLQVDYMTQKYLFVLQEKVGGKCKLLVRRIQLPLTNTFCAVYVRTYKLVVLTIFQHQNKNALQSKSFKRKIYILLLLFRILCQPVIGGTKYSSASTATHSCRPSTLPLIFLPFRLIVLRLKQYIYLILFFLRWISLYIYTKRLEIFDQI